MFHQNIISINTLNQVVKHSIIIFRIDILFDFFTVAFIDYYVWFWGLLLGVLGGWDVLQVTAFVQDLLALGSADLAADNVKMRDMILKKGGM